MKVLLDTNIVIHRENQIASNYSIGHLYRWLDRLNYTKVIHPSTIDEIRQYQDSTRRQALEVKLEAYEVLIGASVPAAEFLAKLPNAKTTNDRVDDSLLYELYNGYVDLLITEDRRLRNKARLLGLEGKVLSIESFIGVQSKRHPELVEYRMLSVQQQTFREIDLNDTFFDSLKNDYPSFEDWFRSKSLERAYVCRDDANAILGFLYLKTEHEEEDYGNISPSLPPAKRLKVGTFKVESTGFRLGERFLKIVFDNARMRGLQEIYLTVLPEASERPELTALVRLVRSWGFVFHGMKRSGSVEECVYRKSLGSYNADQSVKQNFPNLQFHGRKKYILPIKPEYHTHLFPDSILRTEDPSNFVSNVGFRYALQKIYISFTPNRDMNVGDYVLVYRNGLTPGRKGFESVITTLGVITELKSGFQDWAEFRRYCGNRTVFQDEELQHFWQHNRRNMLVVSFIMICSLKRRPILLELWDSGIVDQNSGPRPFHELIDDNFDRILQWAATEIDFVDRKGGQ